jgi:hypothetical protein
MVQVRYQAQSLKWIDQNQFTIGISGKQRFIGVQETQEGIEIKIAHSHPYMLLFHLFEGIGESDILIILEN